ncbi:MAG: pyridoxamine 5'-phosphate oxidase family protein [Thermotogaceae bacterium]|nr:pyridoxamine 5'-phosphate oxidase family protein [Thermotogaceae bacterium]
MPVLPEHVSQGWENREGPTVLTTVDAEGNPNAIYATCVSKYREDILVVADNFFNKTRANILADSPASLLFITKEGKSYQIKGKIEYHTQGAVFDDMKKWNPASLPGHAAAALKVEQVFSGAEKLV